MVEQIKQAYFLHFWSVVERPHNLWRFECLTRGMLPDADRLRVITNEPRMGDFVFSEKLNRIGNRTAGLETMVLEHLQGARNIVEIGCYLGVSTETMAILLPGTQITSIDIKLKPEAVERLRPYKNVRLIQADSVKSAEQFIDGSLDAVYIDADHTQPCVEADLRAWIRKLRPDGFLCGHDWDFLGVTPAVKAVLDRVPDKVYPDTSWIMQTQGPGLKQPSPVGLAIAQAHSYHTRQRLVQRLTQRRLTGRNR
jgi:SAM-dependent methyltransferase